MWEKRGQVTIFIIIAILIVALVLGYLFLRGSLTTKGIPPSLNPPYISFLSCFEDASKEGIYQVASQGGYYIVPNDSSIIYLTEKVPYYYLDSRKYIPSLDLIEEELADSISKNLEKCFDLELFQQEGFEITIDYSVLTNIEENDVQVRMVHPITIKKGSTSAQKKEKLNLDYNLMSLYDASLLVVDSYAENPGFICVTCLEEVTEKNNVEINSIPGEVSLYNKEIIWFSIINKRDYSEDKLKWRFVMEK